MRPRGPFEVAVKKCIQNIWRTWCNSIPTNTPLVTFPRTSTLDETIMKLQHLYLLLFGGGPAASWAFVAPIPSFVHHQHASSSDSALFSVAAEVTPVYKKINTVDDLKLALQQAIELEHATIPPYLCALYSNKQDSATKQYLNKEVAERIQSVVIEEMEHMILSCNMLISIGGSPSINGTDFVPIYPGHLPANLRPHLTVHLRKCSIEQIKDVFLSIEEPEETIEIVDGGESYNDPTIKQNYTIGWFYDEIERALTKFSESGEITFGHTANQVQHKFPKGQVYVIDSLEKAKKAITEIKEQGEGATSTAMPINPDDDFSEYAHFYKFSEIVEGKEIKVEPDGFSYSGKVIPFNAADVYPMVDDPDLNNWKDKPDVYKAAVNFAKSYQNLLNNLHDTFNGNPGNIESNIGEMFSPLKTEAQALMKMPLGDGTNAGPTFQLPPSE